MTASEPEQAREASVPDAQDPTYEGTEPQWKQIAQVGDCPVLVLEDPERWPSFTWRGCDAGFECELAETTPLLGDIVKLGYEASVYQNDDLVIAAGTGRGVSFVADESGSTLGALQTTSGTCLIGFENLWGSRYEAILMQADPSGLAGTLSAIITSEYPFAAFSVVPVPDGPVGLPGYAALGDEVLAQMMTPSDRVLGMDPDAPTELIEISRNTDQVISSGLLGTSGGYFYVQQILFESPDRVRVMRSDGKSPVEPFIEYPNRSAGAFAFADTHVGWHEAGPSLGRYEDGFEAVEIWSSQWAGEDQPLKPEKLATLPSGVAWFPTAPVGGHGYYTFATRDRDYVSRYYVADLETGDLYTETFPDSLSPLGPSGITKAHVYFRVSDHAFIRTKRHRVVE